MQFGLFTTLYDCGGGAETPGGRARPSPGAGRSRGAARLRRGVDGRAPFRALRSRRSSDPHPGREPTWRCGRVASGSARWRTSRPGGIRSGWPRTSPSWTTSPAAGSTSDSAAASGPTRGPSSIRTPTRGRMPENRELFRETVEIVRKAWTEERFAHQGPNYTFPAPDTRFAHPRYPPDPTWQDGDRVLKLRVTPKPYQRPHPPLWMTVSTDRSVSFAAELGLRPCYWQPPPRRVRQRMELYAAIRSRLEGRPVSPSEGQAVLRNLYVAPTMEAARARGGGAHPVRLRLQRSLPRARGLHEPRRGAPARDEARLGVPRAAQRSWSDRRRTSPSGCRSWRRCAGSRPCWWSMRTRGSRSG